MDKERGKDVPERYKRFVEAMRLVLKEVRQPVEIPYRRIETALHQAIEEYSDASHHGSQLDAVASKEDPACFEEECMKADRAALTKWILG